LPIHTQAPQSLWQLAGTSLVPVRAMSSGGLTRGDTAGSQASSPARQLLHRFWFCTFLDVPWKVKVSICPSSAVHAHKIDKEMKPTVAGKVLIRPFYLPENLEGSCRHLIVCMGGRNHCFEFLPGHQGEDGLNRQKETQFSRSMSEDTIEGP
ncbi:unnamed protein product, partial [Bubo scandiacus]